MSDDLAKRLGRLALMAETANHWTDEHRLMPAAGVADIVYEAAMRIEILECLLGGDEPVLEGWDYEDEFFFRHAIDNLRASLEAMK